MLRDVIDRRLVGQSLTDAGVVDELPERIYGIDGLATVFGFYERARLAPPAFRERLPTLFGTDQAGLDGMVSKVESILGEQFVSKYEELRAYQHCPENDADAADFDEWEMD